nr:hypothetical protein [uncultured Campylobacter sp.]
MVLPILKIRPSGQKLVYDVLMLDLAAKRVKFMLDPKKEMSMERAIGEGDEIFADAAAPKERSLFEE